MFLHNIKNLDPIYSTKYGKGLIVSVQWRRDNQLLMCHFKNHDYHLFITSDEVIADSTFSLTPFKIKEEDLKENVVKNKQKKYEEDL